MDIKNCKVTEFLFDSKKNNKTIINIEGTVDSYNVLLREHWAKRQKQLEELTNKIYYALLEKNKNFYKYTSIKELYLIYYFKDNKRRDYDNYAGKLLLDALKNAKVIQDDSCKIIRNLKIQILLNQNKNKIVIVIEGK